MQRDMKLVISDPCLNQLLKVAARGNGIDGQVAVKFRRCRPLLKESCSSCLFCKAIDNVAFLASSIVEFVDAYGGKIIIYLVVQEQSHLYSTYLIDYIRCLYTWIIYFYQSEHKESQLTSLFDLNYTDTAIIPIHDWRILLNVESCQIVTLTATRPSAEAFVFIPEFPFNFIDFFKESLGDIKSFFNEDLEHLKLDCQAADEQSTSDAQGNEEDSAEDDNGDFGSGVETRFEIVPFENVMCCGTFDRLHFGHKLLLLVAYLSCGHRLHVGIAASRQLLELKEDWELMQSYQERFDVLVKYIETLKAAIVIPESRSCASGKVCEFKRLDYKVCDFLCCNIQVSKLKFNQTEEIFPSCDTVGQKHGAAACASVCGAEVEVSIFPLMDVLGPSRYLAEQHVLVISPDVLSGALHVNAHRRMHTLAPWHIATVGSVLYPRTLSNDASGVVKLCSSLLRRLSGQCLQLD